MRIGIIAVAIVALVACDKKKEPGAGPGSGPDTKPSSFSTDTKGAKKDDKPVAKKEKRPDPWGGAAPKEAKTDLGAKTGDKLAKIQPATPSASAMTGKLDGKLERKQKLAKIDKPTQPAVALASFSTTRTSTTSSTSESAPGFSVTYNPSKIAGHEEFRKALAQNRVFDTIAENLNKTIRMPHSIAIQTVDCDTINAFYDPNTSRIIVCYELLDYFINTFKPKAKTDDELGSSVIGATIFSFYHEAGHGLIHQLELPAVGREEDSADQLAALILISQGENGINMALSGAYWFQLQVEQDHKTPFWDEHGFDGQRFYNIVCMIYGSNPEKYEGFVKSGNLPEGRAQRCPEEYKKIKKAWEKLLSPYLTNGAAINVDYTPAVQPKEAPKTTKTDPWGDGETGNNEKHDEGGKNINSGWGDEPAPAITCEDVANKAGELIAEEAAERAKSMSAEAVEELKQRLQTQLPAVMQDLLAKCAKDSWPEASRKCVMNAKSLADATKCQ